jgi:alkylated DNA repair dioxygenase AlkB
MFIMRESADHSRRHSFWVKPSDCVIMFGDCQDRFQHCIRVERDAEDAGPRMSMVFKQSLSQKGLKASS